MRNTPQPFGQPPPEMELVHLAKGGDPAAFAALSERYAPFLQSRAGRYSNIVGVDIEDFVQEGMLALYRAVKGYNPNAGIQFRTYAIACINNSMVSAIKAHMRDLVRQDGVHLDEIDEQTLYRQGALQTDDRPEDVFFQMETAQDRAQLMEALLSQFEREVLEQYLGGHSYQEIAKALGTTTKAVDNALQRVRRKLRPEL